MDNMDVKNFRLSDKGKFVYPDMEKHVGGSGARRY